MTSLDSSSLKFWEGLANWGMVVVIIGVAGEGVEIIAKLLFKKWYERYEKMVDVVGFVFWVMVVFGLAIEFRGDNKSKEITDRENAQLTYRATSNELKVAALNLRIEELRKENNDFASKQEPRTIDFLAVRKVLEKARGMHFILISIPDWEARRVASSLEEAFEIEIYQGSCSHLATMVDVPDGINIGFPTPPDPLDQLPPWGFSREELMKLNQEEIKAFSDFQPSKTSIDVGDALAKALQANGAEVNNWGRWLDTHGNKVLSKLGISTKTVPTNTIVILVGHKPDPDSIALSTIRGKAFAIQTDGHSSVLEISNAWYSVFTAEEEYRARQIRLGLMSTNAPHTVFSPKGFFGDGAPIP